MKTALLLMALMVAYVCVRAGRFLRRSGCFKKVTNNPQDYLILVNNTHPITDETVNRMFAFVPYQCVDGYPCVVERRTLEAFRAMRAELKRSGVVIGMNSAHRSVEMQRMLRERYIERYGTVYASTVVSAPGTSEHHTGLAIDVVIRENGKWITENKELLERADAFTKIHTILPKYGFILRFPKDAENVTGLAYEPWHIRYVGTDAAQAICDRRLTLEEYLSSAR